MKIKEKQYPHPVLWTNSNDFIDCEFKTELTIDTTSDYYTVNANFSTTSGYLRNLISNLRASYAIHIECSSTRYRDIILFNKSRYTTTIPAHNLDGKVEICTFILANEYINDYHDEHFHPDFDNIDFEVWKGDVLGVGNEVTFNADLIHDSLRNIPSIFSVQEYNHGEPMEINLMGNKIVILLSKANFEQYNSLRLVENMQPVLASLVIIPALVCVLEDIKSKSDSSEFEVLEQMEEESRWFRVLKRKLKTEFQIDIYNLSNTGDTTLAIAQKLVGDPVSNALRSLWNFESENDD